MYQEIKPSEGLNTIIDCFWTFSSNIAIDNFKVLPDNCADFIFDLNQSKGFISGIMTKYQLRQLAIQSDLIGVRFKIEEFGFLSKVPLDETKNLRVELSEILPIKEQHIVNQLTDLDKISTKIDFLEKFIETSFKQNIQRQDQMILSVTQKIRTMKGIVNVRDLAKSNHISIRQLERRFKDHIGLTVKEFSSIVRFNNAKKSITTFTKASLSEIAFDMGFYDHSHMNYEFQRISGENPSSFR